MYYLSSVEIHNFKSIINESFDLNDYTPIIGYNNVGKTNLLKAISFVLEKQALAAEYFNNPTLPIIVCATISGLDNEALQRIQEGRRHLSPYCVAGKMTIRRTMTEPGTRAGLVTLEVLDPEVANDGHERWDVNPAGFENAMGDLFPNIVQIEAMQDVNEDVGKIKTSSTIGKLTRMIFEPIEAGHLHNYEDFLTSFTANFGIGGQDRVQELTQFDEIANGYLKEFFPGISITLGVNQPDLVDLIRQAKIKVREDEKDQEWRDVSAFGHGAQRSIQMGLLRFIAEFQPEMGREAKTILLIDEPELYLHPHAIIQVRFALKILAQQGYQIIFATHSPVMVTQEDIRKTIVLNKTPDRGSYVIAQTANAIDAVKDHPRQAEILFELGNSSEFLFAEKVLCLEGHTEISLLPLVYERLVNQTFQGQKIGIVKLTGAGNILPCAEILTNMGFPTYSIVDLDFAFRSAGDIFPQDDPRLEKSREVFVRLSGENNFLLSEDGYPTGKRSRLSAAEAFRIFAQDEEAKTIVNDLHDTLLSRGIWLLRGGDIEFHLGLSSVNVEELARYKQRLLSENPVEVIHDVKEIEGIAEWLNQ